MNTAGLYNPGEFVFDQETGAPYIDEEGALVEVMPGSIVTTPDGRTLSGDNCANAAWLRANLWQGEALRDAGVGVPYPGILGQSDIGLAVTAIVAEVKARTPGVTGVLGVRADVFDPTTRVLRFSCLLQTAAGATTPTKITVLG